MISVKMIGLAALAAQFAKATVTAKGAVRASLDKSADALVADIKDGVPVDDGELRDSVRKEPVDSSRPAVRIIAGDTPSTLRPSRGHVHDVALSTEYGTRRQGGQPFFWPAVRRHEGKVKTDAASAVDDALKE